MLFCQQERIHATNQMKRKIIFLIFVSVFTLLIIFIVLQIKESRNIKLNDIGNANENYICYFDNEYYYVGNDSVYTESECMINTFNHTLIYSDDESLFVYNNNKITEYNNLLSIKSEYNFSFNINKFIIYENNIICIDSEAQYHVIDRLTSNEVHTNHVETFRIESIGKNISLYCYSDFTVCLDETHDTISILDHSDGLIMEAIKDYSNHIPLLSENYLFCTSKTNTNTIILYKYDIFNNNDDNNMILPKHYLLTSLFSKNKKIYFIGTEEPDSPYLSPDESSNLLYHKKDCLTIIDAENFNIINQNFTRQYEKILYVDEYKTITYYNKKYIIYENSSWKELSVQDAKGLASGEVYYFISCRDYLFIFNGNSGKLIDKISII